MVDMVKPDDKPRRHGDTEKNRNNGRDKPQRHRDTENGKREKRQKKARGGHSDERLEGTSAARTARRANAEHGTAMNGARRRAPPSDEESPRGSFLYLIAGWGSPRICLLKPIARQEERGAPNPCVAARGPE
jgi:hypothetical protein